MAFEDYYSLLNVTINSNDDEIRKAFRALVLQLHPDKNPENPAAEDQFKRVLAAYQVISDPEKRAAYDIKFRAYEEALAITRRNADPVPATKKLSGRKARAGRKGTLPGGVVDFRIYASDFRENDVLRGAVAGSVVASIWSVWGTQEDLGPAALSFALALVLPWAGGWFAGLAGRGFKARWLDVNDDPAPVTELMVRVLPTIASAAGAYGALWIATLVGYPLPTVGIIPAAFAGAAACAVGSSLGRAFTSVAEHLSSRLAGLAVGSASAIIVGGTLGAFLVTVSLTSPFDVGFSDLLLKAMVGGGIGSALACIKGAWPVG